MKLAQVIGGFSFGGTERLCLNLVERMPPDISHYVIGLDPSRTGMEDLFRQHHNVELINACASHCGRLRLLVNLHGVLSDIQPDGMILHMFGLPAVIAAFGGRLAGLECIVGAAGNPAPVGPERRRWKALLGMYRTLRVPIFSCSAWVEDSLATLGPPLPQGSGVIYNGVDVRGIFLSAKATREAWDVNQEEWCIGMVSRLDAIKDHSTLLHAIASLPAEVRGKKIKLMLAGTGDLMGELQALARQLGIHDRVEFLGSRSNVAEFLGELDVYAFSTTPNEGFGIALLEAMAAGLPVIATDVPPCREVTDNGLAAILVPPRNADALAQKLERLLTEDSLRRELAERAHRKAAEKFDIEVTAERWLRVACDGVTSNRGSSVRRADE